VSSRDALRWNARYRDPAARNADRPPALLLEEMASLPSQGLALDVAMGLGAGARLLMARGLRVIGVDIAEVGVRAAHDHAPGLMAVVADLERFDLPPGCLDVIVNFRYTQRSLWPRFRKWLRPGGWLLIESFNPAQRALRPNADPGYFLQPGELGTAFQDWRIVRCYDSAPARPDCAGIVAIATDS
jgi:SAM-dependent methyltransferase